MTPRAGEEVAVAKLSFFLFLFASVFSEPKSRRAGRRLMARSNCRQLATCPSMLFDAISASLSPAADRFRRFFVRNVSLNKRIQKNKSVSKKKNKKRKYTATGGRFFGFAISGVSKKKQVNGSKWIEHELNWILCFFLLRVFAVFLSFTVFFFVLTGAFFKRCWDPLTCRR